MTTGSIIIHRDGAQTTVTFANTNNLTAGQVNEALREAGVGDVVHVLTPAEQEVAKAKAAEREARWRVTTLAELREEDQDELREVLHDHGFTRALEELTNDELSQVVSSLIPDSY